MGGASGKGEKSLLKEGGAPHAFPPFPKASALIGSLFTAFQLQNERTLVTAAADLAMLHAIFDFSAFGVVETIHGADEVSGNATDTFKLSRLRQPKLSCFQCSSNRSPILGLTIMGYIGKCGASALCLLISATFTRSSIHSQFNRSSWAVPELYDLIQGVPLSERDGKLTRSNSRNEPPPRASPPVQKFLGGERERDGRGKPFFRRFPFPIFT